MTSSLRGARSWRTFFLTLRDETLALPQPSALLALLCRLFVSQPHDALAMSAASLYPSEVTSDLIFLVELASTTSQCEEAMEPLLQICLLIHDVCCRVRLELNSSSWTAMISFLEITMVNVHGTANKRSNLSSTLRLKTIAEILEILRRIIQVHARNSLISETNHLARFLTFVISTLHSDMLSMHNPNDGSLYATVDYASPNSKCISVYEMQTTALSLLDVALSKLGTSMSEDLWNNLVEAFRKLMDFLASKKVISVDSMMSRFYSTLFHCLHLVLLGPKGSLSAHITGFVTTLQMFLTYGLPSQSCLASTAFESKKKVTDSVKKKDGSLESWGGKRVPYRPPHLRRREETNLHLPSAECSSDCEPSRFNLFSSDSEQSDNDATSTDGDRYRSSKARIAAILCIQDLCIAEPKSITSLWTLLLPESNVLQPRKHKETLMTCLIFDPIMKIRIASSSTLAAMLEGHSVVLLQLADHKEATKCGSFTALSSSLGQILVQLHSGILHLIQRESHDGLLTSLFKVLMLLISATPYVRMPEDLLSNTIASVLDRIKRDLSFKIEQIGLLATAVSCLGAALSKSPPSAHTLKMLEEDIAVTTTHLQMSAPYLLIKLSDLGRHPAIVFEALQALKATSHNYPSIISGYWEEISAIAYGLLMEPGIPDVSKCNTGTWKGDSGNATGANNERCTVAAMKLIDECLRAASGFKGADVRLDFSLLDTQCMPDTTREKRVAFVPSYEPNVLGFQNKGLTDLSSAAKQWSEVIEKHLPRAICHYSSMVRAAAFTCFAGLTSSVFSIISKDMQEWIISSTISAALYNEIPSVKSAACRSIGVLASFPRISHNASLLSKLIHAAEFNTHDSTVLVRVTASWSLANICDSLRYRVTDLQLELCTDDNDLEVVSLLVETALRLTKDGDKIKSNAVRALGHLSRFLTFNCYSKLNEVIKIPNELCQADRSLEFFKVNPYKKNGSLVFGSSGSSRTNCVDPQWLDRMVQAFLSCVTTGNVKVQWNVCYALSNLFLNDTIKLHDMPWAPTVYSILLLLLRDSNNYKIRTHAAVALAVPSSRHDYGSSFSDVVQGLEHALESLSSQQSLVSGNFKHKENFEKQLSLTTLHVLGFVSLEDGPTLKDFLLKKAQFFEGWFKVLCLSSFENEDRLPVSSVTSTCNQSDVPIPYDPKKAMVLAALKSLYQIFMYNNLYSAAARFEILISNVY